MPFAVKAVITGVSELVGAFRGAADRLRNRHLVKAARDTAARVVRSARSKTPVDTGMLRQSLASRVLGFPGSGRVAAVIGPRPGFVLSVGTYKRGRKKGQAKFRDPAKYAHLVELGTRRTRAYHMLRDALAEQKGTFRAAVLAAWRAAIREARVWKPGPGGRGG
jgi:HK97 gp10 family phage protein